MRAPGPWIITVALAGALASAHASAAPAQRDPGGSPAPAPLTQTLEIPAQDLKVRYPDGWSVGPKRYVNADELWQVPATGKAARIMITTELRTDHRDAVNRLLEIASEEPAVSTMLEIGGWPALQRRQLAVKPMRGHRVDPMKGDEMILRVTTAIAAGTHIVRFESSIPPERAEELAPTVEAIGRSATFKRRGDPDAVSREIRDLRRRHAVPRGGAAPVVPAAPPADDAALAHDDPGADDPGAAVRALTNGAEISVAVSNNGRNVVVATNSGYTVSSNAGVTFSALRFPTIPISVNGDPSVAVGASGNFYYALIGFPTTTQNSTAISVSTDNGQFFTFRSNAVVCTNESDPPAPPIPGACFADQEHIAADRFNTGGGGGDQVYSTWRNFDATDQDPALVCTSDSAMTWSGVTNVGSGIKPRIGVGQDGFVYVIYLSGGNVMLNKYSSCAAGLAAQAGFPRVVASIAEVTCPVPGLDRCTGRNTLASYTVDVDDTNANHVYAAFATNTAVNVNENVLVRDSVDGGTTWPAARVVQLNGGGNARRFMPWMCTLGGTAHVTWYDRRFAVATNDLTDFFRGRAFVDGASNLVAGPEVQVTQVSDPQCASGWPCATDRISDSEGCTVQPQPAGVCKIMPIPNPDTSSNARCDFSDCGVCSAGVCVGTANACASDADCTRDPSCGCPAAENCTIGRGCPKYGDYNYSACAAGRIYSVWASATSPPDVTPPTPPTRIDSFLNVELVCCVSRISAPANVTLPATCAGDVGTTPLSVCNTGFTDLVVTGISSSNAQFSVPAAYPVTIAAGACHVFTARFAPTSRGPKSATLTIASNDPVTPAAAVAASGLGKGLESITCPPDRTVGNDPGLCSAVVDPGAPVVQADGCPVSVAGVRGDGLPLNAPYPVGSTAIEWTATDGGGNALSCTQTIVVKDVEPPSITNLAAHPNVLWPPNHKMRMVEIAYDVTDNCDPPEAIVCALTVTSNEPQNGPGDGNTFPDWEIVDAHHVRLRAERSGGGTGRIYTVTATCTDTKNNSSSAAVHVTVPHNQ